MTSKLRSKKFVLMAGNIGSGKTSLTRLVGEKLGWQTAYESVSDNPYLADFYKDMRQWSFHLQVY
ncbi:MAG TPA: deoxynucleoside kinase, partial [Anaerolineaceae bacterium]|nr:deoxynucleoside kinase [Anaerolineaceae bacterium]